MRGLLLFAAGLLIPGELHAQSGAERAAIESLRAELGDTGDLRTLLARESLTVERARLDRDNPMLHLELGFVNFRLGEIADSIDSFYETAAGEFEWARDLRPDWPYPHYGLGLAELALGEHELIAIENIRQILGIDHLSKAARSFAAATERDPAFVQAVLDLAAAATQQRIRPRIEVALEALRRAAATEAGNNPFLQLALGRMTRDVGDMDAALIAFGRFLDLDGDSAIGLLEVARTEFAMRRIGRAQEHYYLGASLVRSEEAVREFRYDVGWIGTPEETVEFDDLAGAGLDLWLRAFWERREAVDLRLPGERMAEHFRRFFFARANYRLLSRHRHYDITERYRSEQEEFDDRGVIYIRHGPPDRVATYNSSSVEPNESWEYQWPSGERIFHFVARDDVADYKLVESLLDVYGFSGAMAVRSSNGATLDRELFASRNHFNSTYRRLSAAGTASIMSDLASEQQQGARAIEYGTTSDSYAHRFAVALNPLVQGVVVAADHRGPAVALVSFALEGTELEPRAEARGLVYAVGVRVSAMREGRQAALIDTTSVYTLRREMVDGEYLPGMLSLELDPGVYVLRVLIRDRQSGAGAILTLDTMVVPARVERDPLVGDLVAGYRGWGLEWALPADTIYMNPTGLYPFGGEVDIHYEMYGLVSGTPYRARIEVQKRRRGSVGGFLRRLFGGGGGRISIEFPGVADGAVTSVNQTIDLDPLDPGEYEIRLTVDLGAGRSFVRDARITILERPDA